METRNVRFGYEGFEMAIDWRCRHQWRNSCLNRMWTEKNIYGHHFGAPHDAADFRRCVALVEQIPEIRDSFNKVAKRVPAFKGILNEWDSLVALLKSEMKIHGNKAPETYRRISELRKD